MMVVFIAACVSCAINYRLFHNFYAIFAVQMWCEVSIVDRQLNKSFGKLGVFIGHHPGYFIIIPVLLTMLCITG